MDSVGVVLWFFREQPLLAAILLLVFELPRYGFSALAMLVASFRSTHSRRVRLPAISAIIPSMTARRACAPRSTASAPPRKASRKS